MRHARQADGRALRAIAAIAVAVLSAPVHGGPKLEPPRPATSPATATVLAPGTTDPRPATGPTTGTASKSAPVPPGMWDAARAEKLEGALDAFFRQTDPAKRKEMYEKELIPQEMGLTLEELEAMLKPPPPEGKKGKAGAVRVECPWLKGNERGWFNFSIPQGYAPTKAWPLVVAMHGSGSDGDNLVSFYSPQLNKLGFFVVYPTVTNKGAFWSSSQELVNIYRIIEWVGRGYRVDFRRLVATGGSMGGVGTWSFLLRRPDIWSAGASVAGYPPATGGDVLENLRGIPFYVLHGEKDDISVEGPRKAVSELRRRNIEVTYVEAPGSGHTPPTKYWQDVSEWIARQPPKAWSPRPLFLPAPPRPSLWRLQADPLAMSDPNDPVLTMIRAGKLQEARARLNPQLAKSPDARSYVLRALTAVPGLLDPYPLSLDPNAFDAKKGWGTATESQALIDLGQAVRCKAGKEGFEQAFNSHVHVMMAKIHAKRFIFMLSYRPSVWAEHWNSFADQIELALNADPGNAEANRLLDAAQARLPKLPRAPTRP